MDWDQYLHQQGILGLRACALRLCRQLKSTETAAGPVSQRARAHFKRGDFAAALRDIDDYWEEYGIVANVANERGIYELAAGDPLDARADFDRALHYNPLTFYVWMSRADANARLGSLARAQKDYDTALKLGYNNETYRARTKAHIDQASAARPAETPQALLAALEHAAEQGERFEQLVARARRLWLAANDRVTRYDDLYNDQLLTLRLAPKQMPRDPDCYVALARLIVDNVSVGITMQRPMRGVLNYRWGRPIPEELKQASELLDQALRLNPNHPGALSGKATVHFLLGENFNSHEWVVRALEISRADPRLIWLHAVFCEQESVASMRASVQSGMGSHSTHRWQDDRWEYSRTTYTPPTPQAQAAASEYERRWHQLYEESRAAWDALNKAAGNDALSWFLQAEKSKHNRQCTDAISLYQKAIALDPSFEPARLKLEPRPPR